MIDDPYTAMPSEQPKDLVIRYIDMHGHGKKEVCMEVGAHTLSNNILGYFYH